MIRLIACDLDGTILDSAKKPDSALKDVMRRLKEKGIRFTFVSGRNEELLRQFVDGFELEDPYITNNGGNIYRKHECLYNDFIPQEYINVLARLLAQHDIAFRLFAIERFYAFKDSAFFASRLGSLRKTSLIGYDPSLDLTDLHVYKITCDFHGKEEIIDALCEEVNRKCPNLNFLKAEKSIYCANSLTASKGNALKKVCEIMGVSADEVMAFGDSENDLSMLMEAGISVAMANAEEEVKEKCDFVCGDNDHNGVSAFLRKYFNL